MREPMPALKVATWVVVDFNVPFAWLAGHGFAQPTKTVLKQETRVTRNIPLRQRNLPECAEPIDGDRKPNSLLILRTHWNLGKS